jgi:hypothetical protein
MIRKKGKTTHEVTLHRHTLNPLAVSQSIKRAAARLSGPIALITFYRGIEKLYIGP